MYVLDAHECITIIKIISVFLFLFIFFNKFQITKDVKLWLHDKFEVKNKKKQQIQKTPNFDHDESDTPNTMNSL